MTTQMKCGDPISLRSTHGRISFGGAMHVETVSWTAPNAMDLLVSQVWRGIYLYPSQSLSPEELSRDPVKVCEPFAIAAQALPADWNHDGREELIVAGRNTILYLADRVAQSPTPFFTNSGPLRGKDDGPVLSIPYDNPHNRMDELGGYCDNRFENSLSVAVWPVSSPNAVDLIVGDWAGNLWWVPDASGGTGRPYYEGEEYEKDDPTRRDQYRFIQRFGTRYLRPRRKVTDPDGKSFLLGVGHEAGRDFPGGGTRPYVFLDPHTGSRDLLVLAGHVSGSTHYLRQEDLDAEGVPVFRDLGPVKIAGVDVSSLGWWHSLVVADWNRDGAADLLLCQQPHIGLVERVESRSEVPAFRFTGWLESADAPTFGDALMETLTDGETGSRLLVDAHVMKPVSVRQIVPAADGIRLSGAETPILDQDGPFLKADSQTDPNVDLACHHLAKWDFDGTGRQHLIVGNDGGLLYLLIEEEELGADGAYCMRSVGPLRDSTGKVIKIHNRVCPAAIDLDGDGREDLLLAGASYQAGIALDPSPGGGVYYVLNEGLDGEGLPRLGPPRQMDADGKPLRFERNRNVQVQALDIDGDGCREVVVCDGGRRLPLRDDEDDREEAWTSDGVVYRLAGGAIALADTGLRVPHYREGWLMDIDGDGVLELVQSGGEQALGFFRKLERP